MRLPVIPVPIGGMDGRRVCVQALISEGRYSRLFGAWTMLRAAPVALKFPKPEIASVAVYHSALCARPGRRAVSTIHGSGGYRAAAGRQTCLYTVMPLYQGECSKRACRGRRRWDWKRGQHRDQAGARGGGAAPRRIIIHPRHQAGQRHLEGGGSLKMIDLGVVRSAGAGGFSAGKHPGTPLHGARDVGGRARQRADPLRLADSAPSPANFLHQRLRRPAARTDPGNWSPPGPDLPAGSRRCWRGRSRPSRRGA